MNTPPKPIASPKDMEFLRLLLLEDCAEVIEAHPEIQ